jgi:hypothetical protein
MVFRLHCADSLPENPMTRNAYLPNTHGSEEKSRLARAALFFLKFL